MAMTGRVVGGDFLHAAVTTAPVGSTLVIQSGLKWRKLNSEQVAEWDEVVSEAHTSTISAVGQAVAGAVLPRVISKGASAAVGAAFDAKNPPQHTVRIDWADGKRSLLKVSDQMFTHLALVLKDRRAATPAPVPPPPPPSGVGGTPATTPTVAEQALSLVSSLRKERSAPPPPPPTPVETPDVLEQLSKLAALRDAGVVTGDEFAAKKAELLSRM